MAIISGDVVLMHSALEKESDDNDCLLIAIIQTGKE